MIAGASKRWIAAIIAVACLIGLAGCAPGWRRADLHLSDILTNPDEPWVTDPKEATDALCIGLEGCLEAWTTKEAYFYRFDSNDAAAVFVATRGSAFQSDRIAGSFDVTKPDESIRLATAQWIQGIHAST